jgi:hypothetical protein
MHFQFYLLFPTSPPTSGQWMWYKTFKGHHAWCSTPLHGRSRGLTSPSSSSRLWILTRTSSPRSSCSPSQSQSSHPGSGSHRSCSEPQRLFTPSVTYCIITRSSPFWRSMTSAHRPPATPMMATILVLVVAPVTRSTRGMILVGFSEFLAGDSSPYLLGRFLWGSVAVLACCWWRGLLGIGH